MKKVTAFVGSAHKKNTHAAVLQVLDLLEALGDVDAELVTLSDYRLAACRGCRLCFEKGEEYCPLKDDRDVLFQKIAASDGVIIATPNYTWQMTGITKTFLDRFGFACHRPRYFGKVFTSIVTQGFARGEKIVETLDFTGRVLGFNTVKGVCLTALDPRTGKDQQKIDRQLGSLSKRYHNRLLKPDFPVPSLFMLMAFRMGRTTMHQLLDEGSMDYRYYADMGWFASDYFYPVHLGLVKKAAGSLFDNAAPVIQSLIA